MTWLRQLFNFYINASIHVALSVVALTWITLIEYHIPHDTAVLYFVFFSSITGYNFVKYSGIAKFHHRRLATWLKAIQVFSFFCFLFLCYYTFQLDTVSLIYIFGFALITFFYAIPLLPRRLFVDHKHNLRSISGLKVYVIALVWTGVTVFLPLINNHYPLDMDCVITGIQRFLFIIALMVPFEIRDLQYDSLKLATLPQQIGVKRTKIVGVLLLIAFFCLEFFKNNVTWYSLLTLCIVTLITMVYLVFAKKEQSAYYSSFFVEGLPILWLLIYLFFDYCN
jgi:hypothetical protein